MHLKKYLQPSQDARISLTLLSSLGKNTKGARLDAPWHTEMVPVKLNLPEQGEMQYLKQCVVPVAV